MLQLRLQPVPAVRLSVAPRATSLNKGRFPADCWNAVDQSTLLDADESGNEDSISVWSHLCPPFDARRPHTIRRVQTDTLPNALRVSGLRLCKTQKDQTRTLKEELTGFHGTAQRLPSTPGVPTNGTPSSVISGFYTPSVFPGTGQRIPNAPGAWNPLAPIDDLTLKQEVEWRAAVRYFSGAIS